MLELHMCIDFKHSYLLCLFVQVLLLVHLFIFLLELVLQVQNPEFQLRYLILVICSWEVLKRYVSKVCEKCV